jgi:hypothetical protein
MCVSITWIRPCTALSNSEVALSLLGCDLQSSGETALTRSARDSSARLGSPATGHHHERSVAMGPCTVRALCTVIRRAALETGGLTVVSVYLPRVSVAGRTF